MRGHLCQMTSQEVLCSKVLLLHGDHRRRQSMREWGIAHLGESEVSLAQSAALPISVNQHELGTQRRITAHLVCDLTNDLSDLVNALSARNVRAINCHVVAGF